ncbi:MAG TPA: NUDIX domain-containing protein [Candidatus Saccharimonadales bacterium]|jgi:diadenosine tetraphosphate (Ap4A) HIT family hydrolase/8-oxo-dGTP pyrophosphatase MutT (NUDIX family)|nr:NUDIX domain-containing protein [Candidatus Saccharimonadales bacterium]
MKLTPEEQKKQEYYRDARFTKQYDSIWQSVGKCVFCDLRDKYIFFEENGIVMTVSLYAYIDGHFMIVPRRHIKSPKELTQLEWDTIRKFFYIAKKLVRDVHGIKGMQLVQKDGSDAQSTVDQHLHFHCIPFDAPDLCEWNYRELKFTPIENAEKYRAAKKKIISLDKKFDEKYKNPSGIRVVCDAIIVNEKNEVLLQERKEHLKLTPDYLTLPGGGVDNYENTLISELVREVSEETGYDISVHNPELLDSRLGQTTITRRDSHIDAEYTVPNPFLWNTYVVRGVTSTVKLTPGDDCDQLLWMNIQTALTNERISPGIRTVLKKVQL